MNVLSDIFAEYIHKRQSGLSRDDTLDLLRSYIRELPKSERQELAGYIRRWENKQQVNTSGTLPTPQRTSTMRIAQFKDDPSKVTRPMSSVKRETNEIPVVSTNGTINDQLKTGTEDKVKCSNCGKLNNRGDLICYSCGFMLDDAAAKFGTRQLEDAQQHFEAYQRFGKTSTMVLTINNTNHQFELRPQLHAHEVIVGRSTQGSSVIPDVDLADYGGDRLGVSRLHMAIKYERKDDAVKIYDLESSNGTFLNGQRLHPKEVRIVGNGDELRLGQMVLRVEFKQRNS